MIRLGLDSIQRLMNKLGNPQDGLKYIHIAGTNGKGSTGTMIAAMLKEASFKVGHYSSPAVFTREEVIKINNRPISKKNYDLYMDRVLAASEEMTREGFDEPTEFETECALSFLYFYDNKVDYVVLECGMGGLSDATNIVNNTKVCVFTPISMDHTDYLGDTLSKIATVKAGIIKPGSIVVSARQTDEVRDILKQKADKENCTFIEAKEYKLKKKDISLLGINQFENASVAIEVVKQLDITDEKIYLKALSKIKMPGRFEKINDKPVIIIDGGHNVSAATSLKANIEHYYKDKKIILVTGMLVNKDHDGVMKIIAPLASAVLTISTFGSRGYSAEELSKDILPYNDNVSSIGGIEEAMELAVMMAGKKDMVVVFGSLSFLKDVKKWNDTKR